MFDTKQILQLFKYCDFDEVTYDTIDGILDFLPTNFSYEYDQGATKLVIIPEEGDYVIKIPYRGEYHSIYSYNEEDHEYQAEDQEFVLFEMPWNCEAWDYCAHEVSLYHAAKVNKVANCFLKTSLIGKVHNYPIYVQKKAIIHSSIHSNTSYYTAERRSKMKECYETACGYPFDKNNIWFTDAFEFYGEKTFSRLVRFLEDNVDDLHRGNLGYSDNRPVVVDYAGYYGGQ